MSIKESTSKKNYTNKPDKNIKLAKYMPGFTGLSKSEIRNKIQDDSTKRLNKILKKLKKKHPGVFHKDEKFW